MRRREFTRLLGVAIRGVVGGNPSAANRNGYAGSVFWQAMPRATQTCAVLLRDFSGGASEARVGGGPQQ